ncbi:MAG: PsbP-related protein [Promethearchaeota archaeon]
MENTISEFKVNEYLSLKLENDESIIYVDNKKFLMCKFLLLNIPVEEMSYMDDIQSIDEAADQLDGSLHPKPGSTNGFQRVDKIPAEVEFWGHCSNLQVWYENEYNTRLLASNLAFPLLKKLTDAGDPLAKRVFNEEIAKRLDSGYLPVIFYLLTNDYLRYLTPGELMSLKMVDNVRSMDDFKRYIEGIVPKTAMEWFVKAQTFELFQETEKNEQILKQGLKKYPNNIQLLVHYTKCFSDRGDFETVVKNIELLISLDPSNADYVNTLGMTLERLGKQTAALTQYEKAIKLDDNYLYPRFNLAVLHHASGDFWKRDMILNQMKDLEVIDSAMIKEVGGFCIEIGKMDVAIFFLKKSLLDNPGDCEIWMALANVYTDVGKPLQERRCLKKVVEINADYHLSSTALNNLGILAVESNKHHLGLKYLEQAVKINPKNDQAWANLTIANIGIFFIPRSGICMEISEKLRDLEVYRKYKDYKDDLGFKECLKQVNALMDQYWTMDYECMFCKHKLVGHPKFCTNCGAKLVLMEDMEKATPEQLEVMKAQMIEDAKKEKPISPSLGIEFKEHINRDLGISFKYPATWMIDSIPGTATILIMNQVESQQFRESVAIMVVPGVRTTLKEYSKGTINQLKRKLQNLKVVQKPTRMKLVNSPATTTTFKGIQHKNLIKLKAIQSIKNQIAHNITYFADVNVFDKSLPIFEEIINSLKIFKPENLAINLAASLQSKFERRPPQINTQALINDIASINPRTTVKKIKQIMEGFMMATMLGDMKGFGPLKPAFTTFMKKLNQNGLLQKLDPFTTQDLDLLRKFSKLK